MRNVTKLSKIEGKVYVYLKNEVIAERFLQNAEDEGFRFGDGAKPTTRPGSNLYSVGKDRIISHVGMAGHIAYQSAKMVGDEILVRVDYEKYVSGEEDYIV